MNLENPPEIADGGYWYVVKSVPEPDIGGDSPGEIPGDGWCAWYSELSSVMYVVVRTPDLVELPKALNISTKDVLEGAGYFKRPWGRVGGG